MTSVSRRYRIRFANAGSSSVGEGTISKTNHGLLFRSIAGDATYPLDVTDWTISGAAGSDLTLSGSGETERLILSGPDTSDIYIATLAALGNQPSAMIYAVLAGTDAEPEIDVEPRPSLILMAAPGDYAPANTDFVVARYWIDEDPGTDKDRIFMGEWDGQTSLQGNARTLSPLKRETDDWAWMMFHANASGDYAMYDGFAAQHTDSVFSVLANHSRTTGEVGMGVLGTSSLSSDPLTLLNRIYVTEDRYVTVTSAPTGSTAEVRDSAGNVLASGSESGGSISVDMMVLGDQVYDPAPSTGLPQNPSPADAVTLVVLSSAGDELARITPTGANAGVWGGDTYSVTSAGTVDFILDEAEFGTVPVVTTQIVHPMAGRSESRPFTVPVLDTNGALLAALTSSERWDAIGRIVDVQYSDDDGENWTTYGAGRCSRVSEDEGPGLFRVEISDESWRARSSRIFTVADTTQMWPHGIKAAWGEFAAAVPADGSRVSTSGDLYRIKMIASDGPSPSRDVLPALLDFVERDRKSDEDVRLGADATEGNFDTLRLNYDGTDYEVVSFGVEAFARGLVGTLENPVVTSPDSEFRTVTLYAWVHSASLPPATGDAYLHAPTAEPSEENPLHVGLADASHTWGVAATSIFLPQEIHPATLTRLYWDETNQVYDSASVTALEADSSFQKIAPLITEVPEDPDAWFQKHVWGPTVMAALVDNQGRRKLVDMRLPQDVAPASLDTIDASNARAHTWQLLGREALNSITWKLLELQQHGFTGSGTSAFIRADRLYSGRDRDQRGCDGIAAKVVEVGPFEGDTIAEVGTRSRTIEALGLHRYRASVFLDRRTGREEWLEVQSRELFDIYQDGARKGRIEIGRTLAETKDEGDLAILDQTSLKGANPATEARTGDRLIRILTMERHPAHAVIEYLDLGKSDNALAAPTVAIAQNADPELVDVTLSNVPAGTTATLEVGYSTSATPPSEWGFRREGLGDGSVSFGDAPGTGWAHARARSVAPGRIRSAWASDSVQLSARPKITAARVDLNDSQEPVIFGTPNANALGVRITYEVHDPGDDPTPANATDYDSADLAGGITLTGVEVGSDKVITVELEPWTGWTGSAVSGTAGPKVSVSVGGLVLYDDRYHTETETAAGFYLPVEDASGVDQLIYQRTFPLWKTDLAVAHLILDGTGVKVEKTDTTIVTISLSI